MHTNDEIVVDDIIDLESWHHVSSVDNMPPCSNFKENIVHKGIDQSLQKLFFPSFLLKKEDVINDAPS